MTVLLVDDDPQDRMLIQDAFIEAGIDGRFVALEDGDQLFAYLRAPSSEKPAVILLDLNLPKRDGRQILAELKADAELRRIPVVVLTTSRSRDDVVTSYERGASSYITKPTTYRELLNAVTLLGKYWLQTVKLPN